MVCLDLEFSEGSHGKTLCDSQGCRPTGQIPYQPLGSNALLTVMTSVIRFNGCGQR